MAVRDSYIKVVGDYVIHLMMTSIIKIVSATHQGWLTLRQDNTCLGPAAIIIMMVMVTMVVTFLLSSI